MRRRRPEVEVREIPDHLDLFSVADWPHVSVEVAVEMWRDARAEWFARQTFYPLELCDGDHFDGTGSEFFAARDAWEDDNGAELPSWINGPDDPFDPSEV